MKVLLDTCPSPNAKTELESAGHDVVWAGDWPEDPGDVVLLNLARREDRVLITLDKDFGELAIAHEPAHHGVIRLVGISAVKQAAVTHQVVMKYGDELSKGALITVEPGRVRIRNP